MQKPIFAEKSTSFRDIIVDGATIWGQFPQAAAFGCAIIADKAGQRRARTEVVGPCHHAVSIDEGSIDATTRRSFTKGIGALVEP